MKRKPRNLKNWENFLGVFLLTGVSTYEPLRENIELHLANAEAKRQRRIERNRAHGWFGTVSPA